MHEAKRHRENKFLTLTYDPENLPIDGSLVPEHFTKFMKKLRKAVYPEKLRYYHCGEYGDNFDRPHYHAALFGLELTDEELYGHSNGEPLYTSNFLTDLWGRGLVVVGTLTHESAAYIARYCTKKVNGRKKDEGHYVRSCPITGETTEVLPEYATMSNRPGIGRDFYERYSTDFFPDDEAVHAGRIFKPPRYYAEMYKLTDPEGWEEVRQKRRIFQSRHALDNSDERLAARERVQEAQFKMLPRSYDNET